MNESDSRAGELARLFEESLSRYQAALAEATSESALRVDHARYAGKEGEIRKRLADALKALRTRLRPPHQGQLRRFRRKPPDERTFRTRKGRIHGRSQQQTRSL